MSLGVAAEAETGALRAYAHPLRLRMLSLLTGAAMSAAEISRELDLTHANASYHLRLLARAGLVEVAEEREVRGGLERRYRLVREERRARWDPVGRRQWYRALAEELVRRATEEAAHRGARRASTSADAELWVPAEVWADVVDRVHAAISDLHDAALPPRTKGAVRTSTTVAMFRMRQGKARVVDRPAPRSVDNGSTGGPR